MLKSIWTLAFIGCALVACEEKELTRDVDYYAKHFEERRKKIAQCEAEWQEKILKYQKEGKQDVPLDQIIKPSQNCKNAEQAEKQYICDPSRRNSQEIKIPDLRADEYGLPPIKNDLPHFLEDDKDRKTAIDQCERNQLILGGSERCKNALKAEKLKQNSSKNSH